MSHQEPHTADAEDDGPGAPLILPMSNVARLMKDALPETAKIARDAKEFAQLAATELIAFVTSEAQDLAARDQRRTVSSEDILHALSNLGFDNYHKPLAELVKQYRAASNAASASRAVVVSDHHNRNVAQSTPRHSVGSSAMRSSTIVSTSAFVPHSALPSSSAASACVPTLSTVTNDLFTVPRGNS